jgi:hypothetical protein
LIHGHEVIPIEKRDDKLKRLIYETGQSVPFGRDSLFHAVKNLKLIGLSRRYIQEYIRRQPIISSRQSKPKRVVRSNVATIRKPSFFATDLVHVRHKDVPANLWPEAADGQTEQADRYLLTVVNLLTSYTYVELTLRKVAAVVLVPMRRIVNKIKKQFKKTGGITVMSSDDGSEFKGVVGKLFSSEKIEHRTVALSPHIESRNAYIQNTLYRVMSMGRAKTFDSALRQTQKIINNTLHTQLGITPGQALKNLQAGTPVKRKAYKPTVLQPNKPPVHKFKVGQRVRKLLKGREKGPVMGYKRYRGEHYTKTMYTIEKMKLQQGYPRYFLSSKVWAWHDELVPASPDDKVRLPVTPLNQPIKKKKPKGPKPATRRSSRLRGKRVDYAKYF